ncbi:4Fe-4S dicluster domain-containing protein [uncultured Ruminococcus sp.]|uniref:4Fe-4S dicluster domain-containing protein n=1 Tax=uncultured Ruminococcus sp. TaxID=165186 RepID=UPI002625DFF3|nr:4Fe-4S dicluster domain-containing protein [uncultured Ruminococcus sp.]
MLRISADKIYQLLEAASAAQTVYIPADREDGEAEFRKYETGMQLTNRLNTLRSAKDFFFPQTENLVEFKMDGKNIEINDIRRECEDFVIFGVRACDARSFTILDKVYLVDPVDSFYKNRRDHGTVVTMACSRPAETCFCQTFGIDPTAPEGDCSVWNDGSYYYFQPNTEKGQKFVDSVSSLLEDGDTAGLDKSVEKTKEVMKKLPLANLSAENFGGEKLNEYFNSDKWAELSESCLGCGTCTFVCPTCQCYDIKDFNTGHGIKRYRCWDSCMYSDFTKMAHGNPRLTQLERFRQRFMHKLVYFPANNNGEFGCVGCGRCLSKCPISMNIVKVMKALEVK